MIRNIEEMTTEELKELIDECVAEVDEREREEFNTDVQRLIDLIDDIRKKYPCFTYFDGERIIHFNNLELDIQDFSR